jgi:hypothetical protein
LIVDLPAIMVLENYLHNELLAIDKRKEKEEF